MILEQETFEKFGYYPSELSIKSNRMVIFECPSCERKFIRNFRQCKKVIICRECYLLAIQKNNLCKECGKVIDIDSNYCQKCFQLGERNHSYKDGRTNKKHYCKDCGKQISYQSKKKLCRSCFITKRNTNRFVSEQEKQKHSIRMKGLLVGKKNPMFGKQTHGKFGYYKNIFMRSSYEIKFAYFLDCSGIKWKYEHKTFDLGNSTYTPDFYLPEFDCYIEIKGYWHPNNIKKFFKFINIYKLINIKILDFDLLSFFGIL